MNKNIDYMATNSLEDIKSYLGTDLTGLGEEAVQKNREKYGANKVKKEKKKS
ncbi:MAG: cation-transporting P-type ATPase, partial [Lachnoanaerobaculum sp.]|nr:cation-transporting P-type ATPase [Lachnoanaerobaculum sp.]